MLYEKQGLPGENDKSGLLMEEIAAKPQLTWSQRTFGKMDKGSLRGSIFTLLSTAIGSGCLTLPYALYYDGLILGIGMLALTAFIAYLGLVNIALAANTQQTYHYPSLLAKCMGPKMGYVGDAIMILYLFSTLVVYQVLLGIFIPSILSSMDVHQALWEERIIPMVGFNILVMIPLALFRELTNLRFVSLFCFVTLFYVAILIVVEFPLFAAENDFSNIVWAKVDLNIFSSFSICLFSYACHTNMPQIQGELANTSYRRSKKVSARGIIGIFTPYFMLALFGYLSCLGDTPELIIQRRPPSSINNDWAMVIAKIGITLNLVFSVPVNLPPCRTCIIKTILRIDERPSTKV